MLYTEKLGLWDCFGFLQIESQLLNTECHAVTSTIPKSFSNPNLKHCNTH